MSLLPDDWFAECPVPIEDTRLTARWHRILFMLSQALNPLIADRQTPEPWIIASLPAGDRFAPESSSVCEIVSQMIGISLESKRFSVRYGGRADGFVGIGKAIDLIKENPLDEVIVGAADSFVDHRVLADLEQQGRLLTDGVFDGFTPGEGAAFMRLAANGHKEHICTINSLGFSVGPDHVGDTGPDRCETLANAFGNLRGRFVPQSPALTVFAGFNGEHLWAKEWGVAALRHRDIIDPEPMLEHPADGYGDLGTATATALVVMAAVALANQHRESPALVFASSDGPDSGCAWLSV
jgi:3-oxoacyl-[acyl-carrier-protein] synthase I